MSKSLSDWMAEQKGGSESRRGMLLGRTKGADEDRGRGKRGDEAHGGEVGQVVKAEGRRQKLREIHGCLTVAATKGLD